MDDLKLFEKDENKIDSLVRTVNVFSEDMGMMFGVQMCGVVVMKRKEVRSGRNEKRRSCGKQRWDTATKW